MVTYTVPVFTESAGESRFAGVVTADISLEWLTELIEPQEVKSSGYAVVLSRQGLILAHPDPSMLMTAVTVLQAEREATDPRAREVVAKMLRGEQGFEPFDNLYLGERARAVFRPVGGAGWSFAVIYLEDELLGDVRRLATLDFAILGVVLIALGIVVTALAKRLTRPLRELSVSAAQIATGDLELALPPVKSDDEVGALTGAFHHMRDSLKEYIRDLGGDDQGEGATGERASDRPQDPDGHVATGSGRERSAGRLRARRVARSGAAGGRRPLRPFHSRRKAVVHSRRRFG